MAKTELINSLEDIWYSNEKRMKSIWRVFPSEDTGKLNIYDNRIRFIGEKEKLRIKNVKRIFKTRPVPSYGAHIISELICLTCIWYIFLIHFYSIEYFLAFFSLVFFLYPVSLFLSRSDWIGIEYKDHGIIKKVFFSDGSLPKNSVLRSKSTSKGSGSLFEQLQSFDVNVKLRELGMD